MKDLIHPTQLRDTDQMNINQIAHGFAIGDYIIYDKTTSSWKKANIIGNYAVGSIGRVVDVESANSLEIKVFGIIVDYTGLTAGEFYYAKDDGTGGLTITPPTSVIQAVLFALPGNKAVELSYPAVTPSAPITPSSTPLGYNDLRTSFTGANWNYEGLTNNGGGISLSGSIAVSGAAGWRYLVVDALGVVSVETIPPAEIVVDTQQFTPAPIFNVANNGYYSSVNPTYRIIAIGFWDGVANILETISYGNGAKKNDDYWRNAVSGTGVLSSAGERLQFADAMLYSRGSNITIVDNGYGSTDAYGCKITNLENSEIKIAGSIRIESAAASATGVVSLYKNGQAFINDLVSAYLEGANSNINIPFIVTDKHSQVNDYYTFVIFVASGAGISLLNIEVTK